MPAPTFRAARRIRTVNLIAQAVLVLTLLGGLNYLAIHHGWRHDLTENRRHSLSPETKAYLKNLAAPVRIVVTLTDDNEDSSVNQAHRDVSSLLREYTEATAANDRGRVTVEYLDVYRQRRLAESHGITQPNIILVTSGDERRVVGLDELYRIVNREKKGFLGEQAFTAAILDVTNPEKKKIYFVQGHGEMQLTDVDPARGLSALHDELRLRNFQLNFLDIAQVSAIPDDAALVVVAAPQGRFDPREEELLRQYLTNHAGRVIVLLSPGHPHGLDNVFYDWGVLADDTFIFDQSRLGQNDSGDLILAPATADQPIIKFLAQNRIALRFGATRSVRVDPGRPLDPSLNVTPLVGTSPDAWAERDYRRAAPVFDEGVDLRSPNGLPVALASERSSTRGNLPFSVRGGRLVVFGGADWIANGRLASAGNLSLMLGAINWMVDRDTLVTIAPRPIENYQLILTQAGIARLRYSLLFILPGIAGLLGLVVYWTRRN